MGNEVYICCKDWLEGNPFPASLNNTNVVLIPKKGDAASMKDYRPIALCNVLYKIMAKVLANRLKVVLPALISENQSAFVPDRNITDNVVVAFEVIHHMRNKTGGQEGEIALKLDVSKAYDRVNWKYLQSRMVSLGFCKQWIDWVMRCVTMVSYDFCFNGVSIGPIIPRRGLRQGDPIFPYLFLFCVECLSNALDVAASSGQISGCRISLNAPVITHLLFVDDSFLFFKANRDEVIRVKNLLAHYADSSGQAINFQKSGIFFSSNVRRDKQLEFSNLLGVYNDISTSNYLGLPSLIGRSKKRVFAFLKEKIKKRIQAWGAKPISRACKTVLLKSVAQSIPSYCMSYFLLPKTLCQEIEIMFTNYWRKSDTNQRKGINCHSWGSMSMSKAKGGLGFRSLFGFNIALLGKHVWRCISNPQLLVSRVLRARYFPSTSILDASKGRNSSFIWKGIWQAKESLKNGFRWVVGDGNDFIIVKDQWLRAKHDFRVDDLVIYEGRDEKVSTLFLSGSKVWDVGKVQSLFSVVDAFAILEIRVPDHVASDRIAWSNSKDGKYDVKSGYRLWHDCNMEAVVPSQSTGWSRIWRLNLPHKMKVFVAIICQ
ncbi:uncharacterized protein LOC141666397 [Apium graveolens]|uniref:uncharacterized protein LOC141666397 n=1 Tax=Apium graveolens TaxID=4045 RepID=UPI003D7B2B27